jgi:ABC-type antimicrobial peptide transport system permease subunit
MTTYRLLSQSLRFHWRIHLAVALGVAAATAVLTGALIVGDSVRGSLRRLALDRLGNIDELLVVDRFFRAKLATDLAAQPRFKELYASATPAILLPSGTVQTAGGSQRRLAANVLVLGSDPSFWQLAPAAQRPTKAPGDGEVILNAPLAEELQAKVGDTLVIRFQSADQVPADSPLGRESDSLASLPELKVIEIIAAEGLGRFSLQPTQIAPRSAFVSLAALQSALDVPGQANAIFIGRRDAAGAAPPTASAELARLLQPKLEDYGLTLKHVRQTFGREEPAKPIFDYYSLSSARMMLDPATERVALAAFEELDARPALTYLANNIEKIPTRSVSERATPTRSVSEGSEGDLKGIPYSTISAIDPAAVGPLLAADGQPLPPLKDDEIVLTSWAADDQQAHVGDRIRVTYFEPETVHGAEREASAEFRVAAIVPLTEPKNPYSRRGPAVFDQPPTTANDPDLTPDVKGITDQDSISDWDAPFPFDYDRLRSQDDEYWENHRATPKAYVSLAAGQRLWGSRFGDLTSIRIPAAAGLTDKALEQRFLAELAKRGERLGFDFIPIRRQSEAAARGTTPFDVLFLLLSMFIIASALMLVWLLFRLGVEQRASEIGLLFALGWSRPKVRWLFTCEGALVAALGAALGVLLGIGYAWLMLAGLKTWWVGAIASPFLELHLDNPVSLVVGFAAGLIVSALTIWLSLARLKQAAVRPLMAGEIVLASPKRPPASVAAGSRRFSWQTIVAVGLLVVAVALAFLAARLGAEAQAGAFMGAGAALLTSLILLFVRRLKAVSQRRTAGASATGLARLAARNAARNPGRSTATIALMASAAFLIVAVSAFRMSPTDQGIGGFDLVAESSTPLYHDLNSAAGRKELLAKQAGELDGSTIFSFRLKGGDDASCRNLYQPTQPRVLGVGQDFIDYFDDAAHQPRFGFSASAAKGDRVRANPWRLLTPNTHEGSAVSFPKDSVPVILDQNTAMYSLKLYGGVGQEFPVTYDDGRTVKFRVVGLLSNSVLQGNLLIGERDFKQLFPGISGYRYFLLRTLSARQAQVQNLLEDRLGDQGFDAAESRVRLADLLAVQNTYISTFQSLGALGLLLGTFGLAAVQLRSVFERRRELALMRATGFRRGRLGQMVLLENLVLLAGGLGIGTLAALVAVLPQMLLGSASIPLTDLLVMLLVVLVAGMATGLVAVRATLRAPLVAALRGE